MAAQDGAASAVTYTDAGEQQLPAPMPPGIAIGAMPTGTTHVRRDHTPRPRSAPPTARSAPPAVYAIDTPVKGAADKAVPDSPPQTPTPVKAEPGLKRAASPSAPARRSTSPSPPLAGRAFGRGVPDPWTQARAQEPTLAHVNALMATMQQTIDMLKEQLADLKKEKAEKADKGKNDKEDGMPTMHYKDVDKPTKFSGQAWPTWSTDFINFLGRKEQGSRWKKILLTIQSISQKPLDANGHKMISEEAKIDREDVLEAFKDQLYEYLKSYTSGDALTTVISNGPSNSFESWRRMCDQGGSTRERLLRDERRAIFHPKQATSETLVKAVAE